MKNSIKDEGQRLGTMPASARHAALSSDLLIPHQVQQQVPVHRPAYVDYIGIKRFDEHGKVVGEDRFIGLYASSIYNTSATQIPSSATASSAHGPPPALSRAPMPAKRC